jgi:hypothetical protein
LPCRVGVDLSIILPDSGIGGMIETLLLVPLRDNQGRAFARTLWAELEVRLLDFGGVSDIGVVAGVWRSGDVTFRDRSRQFVVSLASWRQFGGWLLVAEWARTAFRQEAVYIRVAGIPEILA